MGVTLSRYHVYEWYSFMHLFTEGWQLLTMNFHELMHMWIMGKSNQTITPFSNFHDGRELENLPREKKYNEMRSKTKLVERGDGGDSGWEK